jgi:hypothetical protein
MAARAQAWQFAAALVFFHGSEYVLAAAFHGHRNVTATCECAVSSFPSCNSLIQDGGCENCLDTSIIGESVVLPKHVFCMLRF